MSAKIIPFTSPVEKVLTAKHLDYFTARGIRAAYVKKMLVYSIESGIMFPYFTPDGTPRGDFARLRLLPAPSDRKFTQPKGSGNFFYLPPLNSESWEDVFDDPSRDVYSCEGETRAAAIVSAGGDPPYAKSGCWSWREDGHPIADFDRIEWKGRRVRIVCDADAATKLPIQLATIAEVAELRRRGAVPTIIVIPDLGDGKTGADDYIKAKGFRAFLALPDLPLDDPAFESWALSKEPNATDTGNAARFVRDHGDRAIYVHQWKAWALWDGVRWVRDDTEGVWENARATGRSLYREAAECTDADRRGRLAKWAVESESANRIEAMLRVARTDRHVAVSATALDAHPFLLTTRTGVLDLRTGELLDARPEWLLTKATPVTFDPKARCPRFRKFVLDVMGGDHALADYLQRIVGYFLTGDTREQAFFVFHGVGANGKSTLLNALSALLGDFACATRMETWAAQSRGAGGPSEDIARLFGARMVSAVEAEEEQRLGESLLKELTGGDKVAARRLYEASFEYVPTFKLVMVVNHRPVMRGDDPAVWRRVRLIPFERVFAPAEQDRKLGDALKAELPGILAWAVEGCLAWQRSGLAEPKKIRDGIEEYRDASDTFHVFLDACVDPSTKASTEGGPLYRTYIQWAKDNGHRAMSTTKFSRRLQDRGYRRVKKSGEVYYTGLMLKPARKAADDERTGR